MAGLSRWCGLLRKSAALVMVAALAAFPVVSPVLDGEYTGASADHFDGPGDSESHGPSHNHLVCAVLGSTHSLPCDVGPGHITGHEATDQRITHATEVSCSRILFEAQPRAPPLS